MYVGADTSKAFDGVASPVFQTLFALRGLAADDEPNAYVEYALVKECFFARPAHRRRALLHNLQDCPRMFKRVWGFSK